MGTKRGEPLRFIEAALLFTSDECLIWPFSRSGTTGYGRVYFVSGQDEKGRKTFSERDVHPIVCERMHGPRPSPSHEAAHSCGRGGDGCINWRHLRWATPSENQKDRFAHGTHGCGEKNPNCKLSDEDVRLIREAEGKISRKELAVRFGINPWYVRDIQKGRTRVGARS